MYVEARAIRSEGHTIVMFWSEKQYHNEIRDEKKWDEVHTKKWNQERW